jgi:ABC-type multidrug transport system permease subunit
VLDQARAAARSAWRDPGSVFFAVIMPVGLYAFTITVQGSDVAAIDGVPFVTFYAASMVAWGLGVAAFLNLAEQVALARDRGVLKRLRGTPLAPWQYLAGRSVAGVGIAVLLAALVLGLGTAFYDLDLTARGVGLGLVVLVIGTLTFAACGFALVAVGPSAKAVGAVGLVILLPLAFFSDVFAVGGPEWMSTVGALFPLKHVQNALALAWDPAGPIVGWVSLSVLVLWAAAATAVAVRFFRWEVRTSG